MIRISYVHIVSHATFRWMKERRDIRNIAKALSAVVCSGAKSSDALRAEPVTVQAETACMFLLFELHTRQWSLSRPDMGYH